MFSTFGIRIQPEHFAEMLQHAKTRKTAILEKMVEDFGPSWSNMASFLETDAEIKILSEVLAVWERVSTSTEVAERRAAAGKDPVAFIDVVEDYTSRIRVADPLSRSTSTMSNIMEDLLTVGKHEMAEVVASSRKYGKDLD